MNYNDISKSLKNKSKEDLLQILEKHINSNPSLDSTINFYISNTEEDDNSIDDKLGIPGYNIKY